MVFGAEKRFDRLNNVTDDLHGHGSSCPGSGGPTIGFGLDQGDSICSRKCGFRWCRTRRSRISSAFDAAYRYSDYDALTTDTYKVGMDWAPIQDIRFRGSFQRAVRAANVIELFTAQGFNLFDMAGDPCGWDLNSPTGERDPSAVPLRPACRGGPDDRARSQLDSPAGQYNFLQGGNPALLPEESDTYTYGIILQPRFLPKLAMSIDYFDIEIQDTISTIGADNTLNACYFNGDAAACNRIDRNAQRLAVARRRQRRSTSTPTSARCTTKGYDLNLSYAGVEMGRFGELNFNLTGTLAGRADHGPGIRVSPRTTATGNFSRYDSAASRTRNGGITSASAGSRRGTWMSRSPGVTTTA